MANDAFQLGVAFPQTEIGSDPVVIRDFAQAVEDLGFDKLLAYDHVIGADIGRRPGWKGPYTSDSAFHEPLVLFSYLAGWTKRLILMTGVIILPQRQTVLFGKQAANVDIFTGGRLRIGVGLGWNDVEYEALGMNFANRGKRLDDQIRFLRRLWTEASFSEHGPFHDISEAGINPLPRQRPIPLIVGGLSKAALTRAARIGDGWLPIVRSAADAARIIHDFREAVKDAGRDPDHVSLENSIILGAKLGYQRRPLDEVVADVRAWRAAGGSGVTFDTMGLGGPDEHLALLRSIAEALKPVC